MSAALPLGFEEVGRAAGGEEPPRKLLFAKEYLLGVANVLKRLHNRLCQNGSFTVGNGSQFGNGGREKKGANLCLLILHRD